MPRDDGAVAVVDPAEERVRVAARGRRIGPQEIRDGLGGGAVAPLVQICRGGIAARGPRQELRARRIPRAGGKRIGIRIVVDRAGVAGGARHEVHIECNRRRAGEDDERLAGDAAGEAQLAIDAALHGTQALQRLQPAGARLRGARLHTEERHRRAHDNEHDHHREQQLDERDAVAASRHGMGAHQKAAIEVVRRMTGLSARPETITVMVT